MKRNEVGDIHPNGKWMWTEYKPGKFDWRKRPDDPIIEELRLPLEKRLERLAETYKTMPLYNIKAESLDAEYQAREDAFAFIMEHKDKLDKKLFTHLSFKRLVDTIIVYREGKLKKLISKSSVLRELCGDDYDEDDWKEAALTNIRNL